MFRDKIEGLHSDSMEELEGQLRRLTPALTNQDETKDIGLRICEQEEILYVRKERFHLQMKEATCTYDKFGETAII